MRKREHESKIKRDSKREETGEKLEQVTLNPNAANSARFFLGARDGVGIGIGMRIDASIKTLVGAERTISQWYRKKNNSRVSYVSVGVASELRKLGKSEKGNRWHREARLGPFNPLNSLFSLASVETVRKGLLQKLTNSLLYDWVNRMYPSYRSVPSPPSQPNLYHQINYSSVNDNGQNL